jgi:integrase
MKWKLPPGVHGYETRHGRPVFYLRRPGLPKTRLRGFPGSPEFLERYEAARAGESVRPPIGASRTVVGTVNAALVSYYRSTQFTDGIEKSTQKSRRAILERFRIDHGEKRIWKIHQEALQKIINHKSASAQRNFRKAMRGFVDHCLAVGLIKADPLTDLKLTKMKDTGGFHTWTEDEIVQYRARHAPGTKPRLAFELLLMTGHARADVVRMGRQHIRSGKLSMRRQKTKRAFDILLLPELTAELELHPKTEQLAFLTTELGKPFTAAGFGNWFRDRCDEAGLHHCTAHGLRKAAAVRFALHGATAPELMAWFGWKTIGEAQRYIEEANRIKLAESGGAKIISGTASGSPLIQVSQYEGQPTEKTGAAK